MVPNTKLLRQCLKTPLWGQGLKILGGPEPGALGGSKTLRSLVGTEPGNPKWEQRKVLNIYQYVVNV